MSLYYKMKFKEYIYFVVIMFIGYLFTITQKYYIPEVIRPFTLVLVFVSIFVIFYTIIKPKDLAKLGNYLGFLTFVIVSIIIVIKHIIINFDISYKGGIILIAAYSAPIISAFIYKKIKGQ